MNFWGSSTTSGKRKFVRQSFDDRILEVVAIYGVMHCATSRVVRLQNHRIAQVYPLLSKYFQLFPAIPSEGLPTTVCQVITKLSGID